MRISPNSNPHKAFAWAIAIRSGKDDYFRKEGPSEHWWGGFRQRHPELTLRKPDKLEQSRAESLNPEVVQYFELLNEVCNGEKEAKNFPRQTYNCDEMFVPLNCTQEESVTLKKSKNTYMQAQGTFEHINMALLCAASAAGLPLPP